MVRRETSPIQALLSFNPMPPNSDKNQISYLIRLIDDRDEFVRQRVREELIKYGEDVIPFLEIAARTERHEVQSIVSEIIQAIIPIKLLRQFSELAQSSPSGHWSLEAGVTLLQKFGYPNEETHILSQSLDLLAKEVSPSIKHEKSPEHTVKVLTSFLFFEKGFEGNKIDFSDPDNTYFSRVLDKKKGTSYNIIGFVCFFGTTCRASYCWSWVTRTLYS